MLSLASFHLYLNYCSINKGNGSFTLSVADTNVIYVTFSEVNILNILCWRKNVCAFNAYKTLIPKLYNTLEYACVIQQNINCCYWSLVSDLLKNWIRISGR
jgi:hypothetical protein